jgi:hypothetical protein
MALFVDGPLATLEDLAGYDSSVLTVASTEGIDVTVKLALSQAAIAEELETLLPNEPIERVVVTAALKSFHICSALERVYSDAYNSQLNDRYEGRWRHYRELRREGWKKLLETGVGLVEQPMPKAGNPEVSSVPGDGEGGTLYVRMAWVNGRGEEGQASEAVDWTGSQTQRLAVRAMGTPRGANGWNVYAGYSPHETVRQNGEPLAPEAVWIQDAPVREDGPLPGPGQTANYLRAVPRLLRRG